MALKLNINSDELVVFTNKLEKLSKTAMPNVVRKSLNTLALDVKRDTMLESSNKEFTNRSKNFFKANSRVNFAKGSKLKTLRSEVGFTASNNVKKNDNELSIDDLEKQEHGGKIKGRAFVPLESSRTSKSHSKNVRKSFRLGAINKIVNAKDMKGKNRKEKFVKAIHKAGKGGYVLADTGKKTILWRINSTRRTKQGRYFLTALYTYEKGRTVKIKKATHFMEKASVKTYKKLPNIYRKEAEIRFKRALQ